MNYDRVSYNWNKVRVEVIIPSCPEIGVASDLAEIELNKVGIKMPRFQGRVEWDELIVEEEQS